MKLRIQNDQKGFTLVELAIVMIIIGLLIGGIVEGQELISNAKVARTITDIKNIETAVATFYQTQNMLPGDINNPAARLPGCVAAPCNRAGNANGRIEATIPFVGVATFTGFESHSLWSHLAAADVFSGVDGSNNTVFGQGLPAAAIGGGFSLNYATNGTGLAPIDQAIQVGHWLALKSTEFAVTDSGPMTPSQGARLDRKMDDGNPADGSVRASGNPACATAAAPFVWQEAREDITCGVYIRISD